MYSYHAYGLMLHASLPLPELVAATGRADVVFRATELPTPPLEAFKAGRYVCTGPGEVILAWRDLVTVKVRGGREVVFHPLGGSDEPWLRQLLLGPVLGVLLHQRGLVTLHASAVEIGGRALAFVGWKGQGKSTTAASLHASGHEFLADDIVAIRMSGAQRPVVIPGFPQLKLWPDAVEALAVDRSSLSMLHPQTAKLSRRLTTPFMPSSRPLQGIYVLDRGDRPEIVRLPALDAFAEIVRHTYAARFVGEAGLAGLHFQHCVALAQKIPVFRFTREPSLELLPEALDLLTVHVNGEHES